MGEEILHKSYVVISEYLTHSATNVHLFVKKFIEQLQTKHENIQKIKYFADVANREVN